MSTKRIAIYARVSSSGQDLASQEPDLRAWAEVHANGREVVWYLDKFTGATLNRPAMEKLDRDLRSGTIGTMVVWRLDRLGRTAVETLSFLEQLEATGVDFISIRDGFDAGSSTGRLLRTILAAFAEYEREVISERIRAGIAKAKASGKRWGGRKPGLRTALTPETLRAVEALLGAGTSRAEIARQLSISRSSVYEAVRLLEARRGRRDLHQTKHTLDAGIGPAR